MSIDGGGQVVALLTGQAREFGVVDPATGQPQWSQPVGDFVDLHALGDTVIVTRDLDGAEDEVHAYGAGTGEPLWETPLTGVGRGRLVALSDELALIAPGDSPWPSASVIELNTGEVRWSRTVDDGADAVGFVVADQPFVIAEIDGDVATVSSHDDVTTIAGHTP